MGEEATIGWVKTVSARKKYHCCECGKAIEVGESHECSSGLWEGMWDTYRTCQSCRAKRLAYLERTGEDYFEYGSLANELANEQRYYGTSPAESTEGDG